MAINYIHNQQVHNSTAAEEVLPYVFSIVNPESVIDVGCGTGSWLKVAGQLGAKNLLGVDGIQVDRTMLCINANDFLQHDLTQPLPVNKKFELAICLEVAEHLPESAAENIIDILTGSSDVILFSAAIPGQGGQAHINEQWPQYWQQKFARHNFLPCDNLRPKFWDNAKIEWWYKQNMLLYIKKGGEEKLNLETAATLPEYVHPGLFEDKVQKLSNAENTIRYLEDIIHTQIHHPRFFPTFKRLIKSLIK